MDETGEGRLLSILNQLQLPFDDIEPLSDVQLIDNWLKDDPRRSVESCVADLYLADRNTLRQRARRYRQVEDLEATFFRQNGWFIPGGQEVLWLYEEARFAYIQGLPFAALLCAHATCERALAGSLELFAGELPASWKRWGLGPLITEAFNRGFIDASLRDSLTSVNDIRRVTAHYKRPLEPMSIMARTILPNMAPLQTEEEWTDLVESIAVDDAFLAIKATASLLFGQGLWG